MARNALDKVGPKYRRAIADDVRAMLNAPTLEVARELKVEVVERWSRTHQRGADWLETVLEDSLA